MAKKKRKVRSKPTAAPAATRAAKSRARASYIAPYEPPDFSQEYRYVYYDLRRIAIIATVMLAILVALSFIVR